MKTQYIDCERMRLCSPLTSYWILSVAYDINVCVYTYRFTECFCDFLKISCIFRKFLWFVNWLQFNNGLGHILYHKFWNKWVFFWNYLFKNSVWFPWSIHLHCTDMSSPVCSISSPFKYLISNWNASYCCFWEIRRYLIIYHWWTWVLVFR